MNYLNQIKSYLKYRKEAINAFGVHAPFLFNLLQDVIYQKSNKKEFLSIENIRKNLLKDHSTIEVQDFGAGSRADKNKRRKISSIAQLSSKPEKFTLLIYRLVQYFKPQNILEIGTSFGISTMYMSQACPNASITTMEGCPKTAKIAKQNFERLKMDNIQLIEGNFDTLLPHFLSKNEKLDFVFFDGNHRKKPTLDYFKACLNKSHSDTVFIFDDIHWSKEMEEAWEEIKLHPQAVLCLDFYSIGIVFFKEGFTKESFSIRF